LTVVGCGAVCAGANSGTINITAVTAANRFKDFCVMFLSTIGGKSPGRGAVQSHLTRIAYCEMKVVETMQSH
jgi:hypothetical protein